MRRGGITFIFVAVLAVAVSHCGGSSSPVAPSTSATPTTPTSSTAPVITGVTPSPLSANATAQSVNVNGTNFTSGMTLTLTSPSGSVSTYSGAQLFSQTTTTFVVSLTLSATGSYTFQLSNTSAEKSNALAVAVQGPAAGSWTTEGVRLTNADIGFSGALADTSSIRLADGRWRMFYVGGGQYRSATSSDGLSFAVESGARLPIGAGQSRALKLDDGRVRIFASTPSGIISYISSDEGLTFTQESGTRVSGSFGGVSIVRQNGLWRMYMSDRSVTSSPTPVRVLSATSSDLLTWNMDGGVRLGAGATITGSSDHPGAVVNSNGTISLYYFRYSTGGVLFSMYTSTSTDGLTFTSEASMRTLGLGDGADPDIIALSDGSQRMYYNWGDDNFGVIYSARKAAGSLRFIPEFAAPVIARPPLVPTGPATLKTPTGRGGIIR